MSFIVVVILSYCFVASSSNLLLTERKGHTGEYWPEVVTVRTERSEVRTKTTEGQNSPVWPEQARLVSSLLYGTLFLIVKLCNDLDHDCFYRNPFTATSRGEAKTRTNGDRTRT